MAWCQDGNRVDQDLFDAFAEFFALVIGRAEELSDQFGVPGFCVKALHRLDTPMPLKQLGKLMHCDPSFVTMIADSLEERGLARREPNPADRRVKNLVLTDGGRELKAQLEKALLSQAPWAYALDVSERESLLALIRKMVDAAAARGVTPAALTGEVSGKP
ncbi:MAG TPA: MarR family transcriptional regulator [Streptosporangiaceae bacterium]|nr:MarR family transcriptional regulator [Streptosporangiaceae bacterium]